MELDPVTLAEAGPVAILLVGIGLLALGFIRGHVVPGWLYHQERMQRMKAEEWAERNSKSLALLAEAADDARRARDAKRAADA